VSRYRLCLWCLPALLAMPSTASAWQFHTSHSDPIAPVLLGVTGILFVALLGRFGARKLGLPSVLGELGMGILIGNFAYLMGFDLVMVLREGPAFFDAVKELLHCDATELACIHALGAEKAEHMLALLRGPHGGELIQVAQTLDVFSRYGIIFLLFMVGLRTSVDEMRQVGPDSLRVAVIGVVLPFALGFLSSRLLLPDITLHTSLFLGAALGATSVGISVMVLQELKMESSKVARIILGAAVIDDILGLLLLSIVSGIVVTGGIETGQILIVMFITSLFLAGAIYLGPWLLKFIIHLVRHLDLFRHGAGLDGKPGRTGHHRRGVYRGTDHAGCLFQALGSRARTHRLHQGPDHAAGGHPGTDLLCIDGYPGKAGIIFKLARHYSLHRPAGRSHRRKTAGRIRRVAR
jgi:hypothetical protein